MPPKKHTRAESDANEASTSSEKRQKTNEASETAPEGEKSGEENLDPNLGKELFGYYCIARPRFDFENEANEEGADEEDAEERYLAQRDKNLLGKPIAEHPEHKWVAFWQTWKLFVNWHEGAQWCDADAFGMYVYNDFQGYGLQEVVERMLVAFDDQFKKKEHDEETINHMWAVAAAAVHWLTTEELGPWIGCDDGERIKDTMECIGAMFLSALNELDRAGDLKPDSRIQDLALVMAWYLEWSKDLPDYGFDGDELNWRPQILAYARKAGIDLATPSSGLFGAAQLVSTLDEEADDDDGVAPLAGEAKPDRWNWKKTYAALKKQAAPHFGGRKYDITQWSRKERAKHAFNKKDPLADIPEKEIKAGNIGLA
ncbi:hypothetical protein PGQ11_005525 [Apiospora arundinis]|uniref:Uncharacterized protein n=1 Tax=Apiospora arundinis TaxID=335852 RepID=A0ABR2JB44_9PEZI